MKIIAWISFVLVIIGGINWGLVGFFNFNLVELLFGAVPVLMRIIYALVGIAAIIMIFASPKLCRHKNA